MVNVIDDLTQGQFLVSLMRTLRESFEYVYLFVPTAALDSRGAGTYATAATDRPLDMDRFFAAAKASGQDTIGGALTRLEDLPAAIPVGQAVFLTDNFVPVDNMIAPLFIH